MRKASEMTLSFNDHQMSEIMHRKFRNFNEIFKGIASDYDLQTAIDFMYAASQLKERTS